MNHQLSFDLLTDASQNPSMHFRKPHEVDEVIAEVQSEGVSVYSIDATQINSHEDLHKCFAAVLNKPEPWYGSEGFAPNINSFLDLLDGVHELSDSKAHVIVLRNATQLWQNHTAIAGDLAEWWQNANLHSDANIHLIFVV